MASYCAHCGTEIVTTSLYCANPSCPSNRTNRLLSPAVYTCAQCGYEDPSVSHSCIPVLRGRIEKLEKDMQRMVSRLIAEHLVGDM